MPRWLYGLLIFTVLAPLVSLFFPNLPLLLFIIAGLGILPLAALIGQSVEQVAEHTGERIGGLLFATFGNATELIIGIFALTHGLGCPQALSKCASYRSDGRGDTEQALA